MWWEAVFCTVRLQATGVVRENDSAGMLMIGVGRMDDSARLQTTGVERKDDSD